MLRFFHHSNQKDSLQSVMRLEIYHHYFLCPQMLLRKVRNVLTPLTMPIFRMLAADIEEQQNQYTSIDARRRLYTEKTGKTSSIHKYNVLRWDTPSATIPAHLCKDGLRHIHPDSKQARSITVREAARLQSFPDDYEFIGPLTVQYKMIGNAVPPEFARRLALAVHQALFESN